MGTEASWKGFVWLEERWVPIGLAMSRHAVITQLRKIGEEVLYLALPARKKPSEYLSRRSHAEDPAEYGIDSFLLR
jgi:hypothetical protein